ncbi:MULTISPECIES: DUF2649 family protein [unclassified Spiroplasma]|uniref:DUF2649 family protein n=1 Tax=unclassified Spiroplasma TaxID=2637901 RepID=UPI0030CD3A4E
MLKDWEKLKEFFIHVFLFIDKSNVEIITTWNLTQNEYLTLMIVVLNNEKVYIFLKKLLLYQWLDAFV